MPNEEDGGKYYFMVFHMAGLKECLESCNQLLKRQNKVAFFSFSWKDCNAVNFGCFLDQNNKDRFKNALQYRPQD